MKHAVFAGLGSMGWPMATNLRHAGLAVTGMDALATRAEAFNGAEHGTEDSPGGDDVLANADGLFVMVVNAEQVRAVLFDDGLYPGGLIQQLKPGACVVQMSTVAPADSAELCHAVTDARPDLHYVDAPVSGGVVGAEAGSLTIMAAGSDEALARCRPAFDILGQSLYEVGSRAGQGSTMKAVNQLLCGVHIAAAAEALSLAEHNGIDKAMMLALVQGSAASSWMLKDRGPRMIEPPGDITSAIDIFCKDLGIVCDSARESRAYTPLAHSAHQMFVATSQRGEGKLDDSQLIRTYRWLNGGGLDGPGDGAPNNASGGE